MGKMTRNGYPRTKTATQPFPVRIWTLDVWGNEEDGYTDNDRSEWGTRMITAEVWNSHGPLIRYLKEIMDSPSDRTRFSSFEVDAPDGAHRYIDVKGRPLLELEIAIG